MWDKKKIKQNNFGGLLAVNMGSPIEPTFSILEHKPAKPINKKPIVLVGKGVVYDTGGLSIKPTPDSMDHMKSDMTGAAVVLGTFMAVAKSKLNFSAQFKDYLTICAPFNGIVTQRNIDLGTLTNSGSQKPLLVIEDVSILRLRLPVPESYTAAIPDTSTVDFSVEAMPGKRYIATLSRKSGSINLSNRTETWEYIYKNNENKLKSGMFANATLKMGREESSFLVPSSAIVTTLEKKFVVRLKEGKTEWVDVKSGFSQNDKVEIFGSLNEGDLLIVGATDEVKPGTELAAKLKKK